MNLWQRLFGKKETKTPGADEAPDERKREERPPVSGGAAASVSRPGPRQPAADKREIRVFISSTFRDMMKERDLLVKHVFPDLRRKCAGRFVTFTEVDLRWGITEEQAAEGQVLPLCLAEIERSRPYFIGLLGERYGWIPDEIRPDVLEREPWLKEHVQDRTSVTELEILHGVLNDPEMENLAFFYFRDPAYVNHTSLSKQERKDMVERDIPADIEKYGPEEAAHRTSERKEKLAALKQRIRDSGLPVVESYASPEALADIIRKQFDELIDRLYPQDETPDPLTQERLLHESHAASKLFACIDRPAHLKALSKYAAPAEHDGRGLVVTGDSGCGKSALLAAWARDYSKDHPDEFLFQHYFGATPESASPTGFLYRLMGELKSRYGIAEDIPTDPEKLRDALPVWLAQTIGTGRIVLVLDGLNQVQGDEPDRALRFLPRQFPPHVTVIASSLPGPALDALRQRGWTEHELPLASEDEVDAMAGAYLSIHARALEPALRRQLVTAPGARNPLFLRTVLEELRQFGSFEKLPDRVAHYLKATGPAELFLRVIRRWQDDFDGKDRKTEKPALDLVRRALAHLWAARQGFSEPEWLDLLGDGKDQLPRAHWTPLFLAMEPHLVQRAGLFTFGHDFLRQAAEEAFLSSEKAREAAHLAVADYFELHEHQKEMSPRKAAEWPHQLFAAEAWERLEACLTDIPLFLELYNDRTKWDLTGYWHPLRRAGRDMGECYTAAYARWCADPVGAANHLVPHQLGTFLLENGLYPSAEPLLRRALEARERVLGAEHPDTLGSVNNLAGLLESKGDYAGAQPLYERALEGLLKVSAAMGGAHPDLQAFVGNYAGCLKAMGRSAEEVQAILQRMLERYGMSMGDGGSGASSGQPSPQLLQVLQQLMQNPSSVQEIAETLQREDPALFAELMQFLQSQK